MVTYPVFSLQGSAHTGPALTPAEVLVAIHIISPEKDGVPLKKVSLISFNFSNNSNFSTNIFLEYFFLNKQIFLGILQIMDACGTCFEQRTVFTQQILVKALDELVSACYPY